jgi:hypothetical protein
MPIAAPDRPPERPPVPIRDHALESLRVIRDAMERAGSFTAVPGWGTVAVGISALVAAWAAARAGSERAWLFVWVVDGAAACAISLTAMVLKARRIGLSLGSGVSRKFALAFVPALAAGAVMTWVLARHGLSGMLPGTWLLLYGAAVTAAGALSVRIVPLMGLSFMALGIAALAAAPAPANVVMAAGFGGLHIVFGIAIARRHGG